MVRPPCRPRAASRGMRWLVERGSMPYSAVTQPCPIPFRKLGTFSSTLTVQITRVSPNSTNTEPSAWRVKRRVIVTARNSSGLRPLGRISAIPGDQGRPRRALLYVRTRTNETREARGCYFCSSLLMKFSISRSSRFIDFFLCLDPGADVAPDPSLGRLALDLFTCAFCASILFLAISQSAS